MAGQAQKKTPRIAGRQGLISWKRTSRGECTNLDFYRIPVGAQIRRLM
jgi:hypothetical protein